MEVSKKTMQKKGSEGTENPILSPIHQAATREEENVKEITSDENPREDAGARKVLLEYTRRKSTCNQELPNTKDLTKDDDGGDSCNRRLAIGTCVERSHKNNEADVGCGSIRDNASKREGQSQKGKKPVQVSDRVLRPRQVKQPKESEVIHNLQKQKQHTTRDLSSRPETGNNHQKELESRNGQNEQEIHPRVWFKIDTLTVCLPTLEPDASSIYQASIRGGKEPQGGNARDIGDGEKVHQTEPATKPEGAVGSDGNTKGDHDDQVQQAASKDLGGGSDYDIELTLGGVLRSGIPTKNGHMLDQDDRGMHMKQNPLMILDGKKRSSPENGEESRKKNRFWLFGHEISCEKKQAIWESGNKQPATSDAGVRFLGADICVEQVRPISNGFKDGESIRNHVLGSDHDQGVGKSSMQQPKSGLRLFGLDLQN